MAFYPDELSPIDQIRSLGKQADPLSDLGPLKNRRQWKSLVLGKKDMGMNNFATITEEKEEEISSDGSQGANSNKGSTGGLGVSSGVVANKKIIFPKPRKYITSRVSDRKEDTSLRGIGGSVPFSSLSSPIRELSDLRIDTKRAESPAVSNIPKTSAEEAKQFLRAGKSKERIAFAQNFTQNFTENFAFNETPIEIQWNEAFSENTGLANWSKPSNEKINLSKHESSPPLKSKQEEKKKSNESSTADSVKREVKGNKKKGNPMSKKPFKKKEELSSTGAADKIVANKGKQRTEKGKTLNMKEVVNVYKNLAYGSKKEIKSFVENLSFVKDEPKTDADKNLLSMMNLKALESKIKNFTKKSGKNPEASTSKGKKPKTDKPIKKCRKAHIERLARHKVVKVPAVSKSNNLKNASKPVTADKSHEEKEKKKTPVKDKEPWKYVGMESALDKTYFVYPAYPPSVNLKNAMKNRKTRTKGTEKTVRRNKGSADVTASKASEPDPKVKSPQVVLRPNLFTGGGLRASGLSDSGSASNKSVNRPSATTVCTVEFRPAVGQKTEEPPVGATDQSLLVYLHGTKAIHVKSPYSDRQFSRVKFFRKDERGMPLIRGLGRRAASKGCKKVSVRNISLPEKLNRVRSLDLLDFNEDIQNITDFLRSQKSSDQQRQKEWQEVKKSEKERWPKESPKEQETSTSRHQRRQRLPNHHHQDHLHLHPQHQHGTSLDASSPYEIIQEISRNVQYFQYLPDTEDNRKMIGQFFDELDRQIEISRKGALALQKFPTPQSPDTFRPIPILGY